MKIHFHHQSIGLTNGVYAIIKDLQIERSHPELDKLCQQLAEQVIAKPESAIHNEVAEGYDELLTGYDTDGLTHAGKNWVELIRKRGKFLSISTAVDAYNIVVAQTCLGFGAHDLDKVVGDVTFDFATAAESIMPVNATKACSVNAGDFVYRDEEKILAWLDVRDCDAAKITLDTKNILLIIEGNRTISREYNLQHITQACDLVTQFCGGTYETFALT